MSIHPASSVVVSPAEGPQELATPVRRANPEFSAGQATLLRDVGSSYRDGAEDDLLDIVLGSDDLGSLNEELHSRARSWAERYHLDRQRANVLRAFDVDIAERVLEVGAGCGAMSRYLAETCPVVDALEPVPARAAVAAARVRDLPGARVFTGELADLPDEPSYDLVVVIGVLEYVGAGTADTAPYLDFLDQIRRRLRPGGRLLLAIENKLGVKYLAGAPEDHSDRAYDSIQDYPIGTPARTFDRAALCALFEQAGFVPAVYSAFPDYKLTRAVLADGLMADSSGLAARLPRFPSPDWQSARDLGPNEELLWRTLVQAGLGAQHGNSFVVVAGIDGPVGDLWPAEREGVFYTTDRRPGWATETEVLRTGEGLTLDRRVLGERREDGGPLHRTDGGPVLPGRPLVDVIAEGDVEVTRRLLGEWRAMVEASAQDPDGVAIDLVPHNLLLDDGRLLFVDDEWRSPEWTADHVVARGLMWLCERLSTVPSAWQDRPTRRVLLDELAGLMGLAPASDWFAATAHREALLQVRLMRRGPEQEGYAEEIARTEQELAHLLELPVDPAGAKLSAVLAERDAVLAELARERSEHAAREEAMRQDIVETHARLAAAHEELGSIHDSLSYRVLRQAQAGVRRVVPDGSRRRTLFGRATASVRRRRS